MDADVSLDTNLARTSRAELHRPLRDAVRWNFRAEFDRLQTSWRHRREPVEVNFRHIVPLGSGVDRATHLFHPYPAKLLLNIPLFFLSSPQVAPKNSRVFDPFCGSGTVLVEALLAGHRAAGADANPLARLIAQAKTCHIPSFKLWQSLQSVLSEFHPGRSSEFSPVVKQEFWFTERVAADLSALLYSIRQNCDGHTLVFMEACFSSCVKRLSVSDPRLSVPVRLKGDALEAHLQSLPDVRTFFEKAVRLNIARLEKLPEQACAASLEFDARHYAGGSEQADLIITSPPYAGAQKYIRSSSLSIGWLGLAPDNQLRTLERQNIGREHFSKLEYGSSSNVQDLGSDFLATIRSENPLRSHIADVYLHEMNAAADAITRRLANSGHLVLVVGDNMICGRPFPTSALLKKIFLRKGLTVILELVDDIRSRGLMTKRNKTAGTIEREHVVVFQKV
ncbi:hypothetical protein HJA77_04810 [Rhizobium bangladeshense]|uniref:hypothetical protein n=1 Tax=Rhizobium bangladeshense TaxID=1138189 RepID=UPI001C904CE1|nr:hypothetical protein [Rhizobium bangladeshense]MBY3580486.1 hypothetical protein [Rhizobium bangladeshense]